MAKTRQIFRAVASPLGKAGIAPGAGFAERKDEKRSVAIGRMADVEVSGDQGKQATGNVLKPSAQAGRKAGSAKTMAESESAQLCLISTHYF